MADLAEKVTQVFKRFDKKGNGKISRSALSEVLKRLDNECWSEANVDELLKAAELQDPLTGDIDYEQLVEWIMESPPGPLEGHPVCQAAYEGNLEQLEELLKGVTFESLQEATGYIKINDEICGLWTMCTAFNTFQLKALRLDGTLRRPTPLHWAAFSGKAAVVRYLVEDCGLSKDFEADFGFTPFAVAASHRLDLEDHVVEGEDEEVKHLLEDEAPLCPDMLSRAMTRRLGGTPRETPRVGGGESAPAAAAPVVEAAD